MGQAQISTERDKAVLAVVAACKGRPSDTKCQFKLLLLSRGQPFRRKPGKILRIPPEQTSSIPQEGIGKQAQESAPQNANRAAQNKSREQGASFKGTNKSLGPIPLRLRAPA